MSWTHGPDTPVPPRRMRGDILDDHSSVCRFRAVGEKYKVPDCEEDPSQLAARLQRERAEGLARLDAKVKG